MVPDFVDAAALAVDGDASAVALFESGLDVAEGILLGLGGCDASISEPLVGGQTLEHLDNLLEVDGSLLGRLVVRIAVRLQRANTGTVLTPLVLPEGFIVALVVLPVGLHVREGIIGVEGGQDIADVAVLAAAVTRSRIRSITPIRP